MPGRGLIAYRANPRNRINARMVFSAVKKAAQLKKEWDKSKASPAKKAERKERSDKGKKRYKNRSTVAIRGTTTNLRPREMSHKSAADYRRFPQTLAQKYFLTNITSYVDLVPGIDGTIVNPTMLYSKPSSEFSTSSIVVLNVANTEAHWIPRRSQAERVYRTGIQLTGEVDGAVGHPGDTNDSFLWYQNADNTSLVSDKIPMKQNGLAENAVGSVSTATGESHRGYTIPNSVLTGVKLDIQVGNPLIQDILLSVKVVRRSDTVTIAPSTFGTDLTAAALNINSMTNARAWTDPNFFSTLYSTTVRLKGLKTGNKMKLVNIRKMISTNLRRSQYRKQYNADNMANIGTQAKPSFGLVDDNTMYNSVYVVMSATLTSETYIADVQAEIAGSQTGLPTERVPQIATYPPLSVGGAGRYTEIPEGCMFKFGGTVSVFHRVEAIRRAIGGAVNDEVLQLQAQIDELKNCKPKKRHLVEIDSEEEDHK